jgi:hypothetical protein
MKCTMDADDTPLSMAHVTLASYASYELRKVKVYAALQS